MFKNLSNPERKALLAVDRFIRDNGFSPSVRDVQAACGWKSVSTAKKYLDHLVTRGLIVHAPKRGRTFRLAAGAIDTKS